MGNPAGVRRDFEALEREASGVLDRQGFKTQYLVIRDPESAIRHLQQFADHGVVLAIDDYGAGLSSLAYLKQLPAKELKIDKMFVTQLTSSHRDPLIVRSTIDLAHDLGLVVVAEGIEDDPSLERIAAMGDAGAARELVAHDLHEVDHVEATRDVQSDSLAALHEKDRIIERPDAPAIVRGWHPRALR